MKRILKIALLALPVLLIGAWLVLRLYLHSSGVASQVSDQLISAYGGPVALKNVDIGLTGTTVNGLRFFEPGHEDADATPWLTVDSVNVDLSVWDLIRGDTAPKNVSVHGARVLLRLDDAGNLATRFPEQESFDKGTLPWDKIPQIRVDKSEVVFRKMGQGDLVARNIEARLVKEGDKLVLSGNADSDLGRLTLHSNLEKNSPTVSMRIGTAATAHVTQTLLERFPFVPRAVFQEIQIPSGDATGALVVSYDLANKLLHYRADLNAMNTKVYLPSVAIAVHDATGKVVIDDNLVEARGIQGKSFGGTVTTDGKLDFRGDAIHLILPDMKLANLDVHDVPEAWGITTAVRKSIANGKLNGTMNLDLTVINSGATADSAAGLIATAAPDLATDQWLRYAGVLAALPHYQLQIKSEGKGEVRDPQNKKEPIQFDWQLNPKTARPGPGAVWPRIPGSIQEFMALFTTVDMPIAEPEAQVKSGTPPRYFDFKFNLKNASLAELIKNEDVKLPFPVDGKISFNVKASIPAARLRDLKAYKAEGSAHVQQLTLANLKLDELTTDFKYVEGTLYLDSVKSALIDNAGKASAGMLSGSGQVQLVPLGSLHADLKIEKVALDKLAGQAPDQLRGIISGELTIDGAADKLGDTAVLDVRGRLASQEIVAQGFKLEQIATSIQLKEGLLTFPDLQARLEGELIKPTASVQLSEQHTFVAKINMRDFHTDALRRIAAAKQVALPSVEGMVNAEVVVAGKFNPTEYTISGDVQSKSLKLEQLETKDVRVHWELDKDKLKATDVNASLYDGKATGTAAFPLDGKSPGKLDLQVHELNLTRLAKDVRMPIDVEGRVEGALKGTFTPARDKEAGKAEFHVDFKAPKLRVQNIPTEQLKGKVEYQQGQIDYNLTGSTLGGTFDLEGQVPRQVQPDKKPVKGKEGHLRIQDVRVGRLLDALGASTDHELQGLLNIDVRFHHSAADRFPVGQGSLRVSSVKWRGDVIADAIGGDIVLADQQLRIRNIEGNIANGTLEGQVSYYFRDPERSQFTLNMESVELNRLLAPWAKDKIEGNAQVRIRGALGNEWNGNADIDLGRGKLYGLEIAQWRLPITWSYAPSTKRAQLDINDTSAQLVQGRANGKLNLTWEEDHARVDGSLRIDNVELRELLRETIGSSDLGAGRTTAKIEFKGNEVRLMRDLSAKLVASFNDTQALQAPVLKQAAPYLGLGPSTTFQQGNLVAHLSGGTLHIDQMALQGNNVQVFIDGSMTLEQQLNLHVVAKTGDIGWPTVRLGPIGLRIPIAGPVPVLMLQEASALISNHVVYLDVTGTPRSPVIRPRPLPILSAEAVRFFLNRANLPVTINP
jgi:AsmA-like protein